MENNTRGIAYTRYQRNRAINRKKNILIKKYGEKYLKDYHKHLGKLNKGKIHCSCYMCRTKSYDELSHRDKKKEISAKEQIQIGGQIIG